MELMGLGLKATVPLGFLSFWRGLGRLKSILKVLADSRNLWGFGGCPEVKRSKKCGIDGFGPQGNRFTWFFVLLEGFG